MSDHGFHVGSRVRYVSPDGPSAMNGQIGTVVDVHGDYGWSILIVAFDNEPLALKTWGWPIDPRGRRLYANRFEPAEPRNTLHEAWR